MFSIKHIVTFSLVMASGAFSPARTPLTHHHDLATASTTTSSTTLFSEPPKKKGGLDTGMRSKLVTESIAPWRTLRLFLYGAFGSGAFIGGLINISGAVAGSNSPDFNLNTELLNVGIDFGAVALFAFLAKFDIDKQNELQSKVDQKIERKKEMKEVSKSMKERESLLRSLPLEITVGNNGETTEALVGDLQKGAKQHMIIVAGPRKACTDALIGANLLKMDFAMSNVLVVPYQTDVDKESRPSGGFAEKPIYERQAYVAKPASDDWADYIKAEMNDAVKQSGEQAKKEGIALVVASNGKVIRRGVGKVPWRQMVDQLQEEVNPSPESPLTWL
mmetsp:Transcript_23695/g.68107  ORF Transcript_23695/g.68107 Transcript_23695/m.68107 type:complete len:333 (+) Transcript_23695:89-1087(+)